MSEQTDTPWQADPITEADPAFDFVSEVAAASAVVAVAVPVTAASAGQRRLKSMAGAMALAVAVIVGSLAFVAMISPRETPSPGQTTTRGRTSPLTAPVPDESLTGEASVPLPPPSPGITTQASAEPTTAAPPGVSGGTASMSTVSDGQLKVTSDPSGARVTVNGIGWGETPLTIEHLSPGMKTLRVTREGCASEERIVDIRGSRRAVTLHVTLKTDATCF